MRSWKVSIPVLASAGLLFAGWALAQPQEYRVLTGRARFIAHYQDEPSDIEGKTLTSLDVTFYGAEPSPQKAEKVLQHLLKGAIELYSKKDILVTGFYDSGSGTRIVSLKEGSKHLYYSSKDRKTRRWEEREREKPKGPKRKAARNKTDDKPDRVKRKPIDLDGEWHMISTEAEGSSAGQDWCLIVKDHRIASSDHKCDGKPSHRVLPGGEPAVIMGKRIIWHYRNQEISTGITGTNTFDVRLQANGVLVGICSSRNDFGHGSFSMIMVRR